MILPFPIHFKDWKNYPFTLLLLALNICIYFLFFSGPSVNKGQEFLNSKSLELTGRLYLQYLQQQPADRTANAPWVQDMDPSNSEHLVTVGVYALRDASFFLDAKKFGFKGDRVEIEMWQTEFSKFRNSYETQALYRFGLNSLGVRSLAWITYQFSHASFLHLFSNMIFLFLLGMAVESLIGGPLLLLIYILGGVVGGGVFLGLDSHGNIPMVGASASISALIAFFWLAETRKRIRYYYFISPVPGQHGAIYLPTLLMVPFFLLSDVGNLWSQPQGLGGGVAYAAHLGGTCLGIFAAVIYKSWQRQIFTVKSKSVSNESL